ncbi:MAG: hypothetical protein K2J40_07575 [Ruminococcus sp.]|nr:hypothetical protein [Ruminococcus sp.]
MRILNIHGYKGMPENSACHALENIGEVISPTVRYDSDEPEKIIEKLRKKFIDNECDIIVGTSLGGFFGVVLSARLDVPVILVNPCLMPFVTLPRLGFTGNIQSYMRLFPEIADIDVSGTSTIIGGQDEVIDYHDFTEKLLGNKNFRIVPDGKHSGATLPLESFFREILQQYI